MPVQKWEHGYQIKATKFPLVGTLIKDKSSLLVRNILEEQLDESTQNHLQSFFCEKTLKASLKKQYNCHSPQLVKAVVELLFCQKNNYFRLDMFLALDVLSELFLQEKQPALTEFVSALKCVNIRTVLIFLYPRKPQIKQMLSQFTPSQRLTIIMNSAGYKQTTDMLYMYSKNPQYFNEMLNHLSFIEKNSFSKLHDYFAIHNKKLAERDFQLNQQIHFPNILKLNEVKMEQFEFAIPSCYYTLIDWGAKLGHCIGSLSYAEKANRGHCLLLGLIDPASGEIKYTMEIVAKKMVQIQGYSGSSPSLKQKEMIIKELKKLNLHS